MTWTFHWTVAWQLAFGVGYYKSRLPSGRVVTLWFGPVSLAAILSYPNSETLGGCATSGASKNGNTVAASHTAGENPATPTIPKGD